MPVLHHAGIEDEDVFTVQVEIAEWEIMAAASAAT